MTKPVPSGAAYFKPELSIDYKPVEGIFRVYDYTTTEVTEIASIKFLSAINVYKYENGDENFTSNIFENMFSNPLTLRYSDSYKYLDTVKYEKESKTFVSYDTDKKTWKPSPKSYK